MSSLPGFESRFYKKRISNVAVLIDDLRTVHKTLSSWFPCL